MRPVTIIIGALLVAACGEPELGKYCTDESDPTLHDHPCASGICLKQRGHACLDDSATCSDVTNQYVPQPVCTRECLKSADCRDHSSQNINECTKFVCQAQGPETGFGGRCLCVCLDFVRHDDGVPLTPDEFEHSDEACGP